MTLPARCVDLERTSRHPGDTVEIDDVAFCILVDSGSGASVVLSARAPGKPKAKVQGKGADLGVIGLPLAGRPVVTAELRNLTNGTCVGATYSAPFKRNTPIASRHRPIEPALDSRSACRRAWPQPGPGTSNEF